MQAWINFGWAQNLRPWGNVAEPGTKFSPSGYRLARVIWIHYISKASPPVLRLIALQAWLLQAASYVLLHQLHPSQVFACLIKRCRHSQKQLQGVRQEERVRIAVVQDYSHSCLRMQAVQTLSMPHS